MSETNQSSDNPSLIPANLPILLDSYIEGGESTEFYRVFLDEQDITDIVQAASAKEGWAQLYAVKEIIPRNRVVHAETGALIGTQFNVPVFEIEEGQPRIDYKRGSVVIIRVDMLKSAAPIEGIMVV